MFSLIKQEFIVLLSFSSSLAHIGKVSDRTKCLSLNDEPCMVRTALIDLDPVQLKYYLFMIKFDKCNFISDHVTIDNYYYLLSLCKA